MAGSSAQILGREGNYVMIRLSSGEQRRVLGTCMATIGVVGNEDSNLVKLGKLEENVTWEFVQQYVVLL